jgi:hypothetical protein
LRAEVQETRELGADQCPDILGTFSQGWGESGGLLTEISIFLLDFRSSCVFTTLVYDLPRDNNSDEIVKSHLNSRTFLSSSNSQASFLHSLLAFQGHPEDLLDRSESLK